MPDSRAKSIPQQVFDEVSRLQLEYTTALYQGDPERRSDQRSYDDLCVLINLFSRYDPDRPNETPKYSDLVKKYNQYFKDHSSFKLENNRMVKRAKRESALVDDVKGLLENNRVVKRAKRESALVDDVKELLENNLMVKRAERESTLFDDMERLLENHRMVEQAERESTLVDDVERLLENHPMGSTLVDDVERFFIDTRLKMEGSPSDEKREYLRILERLKEYKNKMERNHKFGPLLYFKAILEKLEKMLRHPGSAEFDEEIKTSRDYTWELRARDFLWDKYLETPRNKEFKERFDDWSTHIDDANAVLSEIKEFKDSSQIFTLPELEKRLQDMRQLKEGLEQIEGEEGGFGQLGDDIEEDFKKLEDDVDQGNKLYRDVQMLAINGPDMSVPPEIKEEQFKNWKAAALLVIRIKYSGTLKWLGEEIPRLQKKLKQRRQESEQIKDQHLLAGSISVSTVALCVLFLSGGVASAVAGSTLFMAHCLIRKIHVDLQRVEVNKEEVQAAPTLVV
jgi:hypothetical protein